MVNRIEQFHQSFTRKTESTDTRQAIQRHDPDHFKKKKDKEEEGGFKDPYEDLTNVSINALITFLEGLIDKIQPEHGRIKSDFAQPNQPQNRPPASPRAAAAMNAYQTRAADVPTRSDHTPPHHTDNDTPMTVLDTAIAELDPDMLKSAIRELRMLNARGIHEIGLERGDGFLESILLSIKKFQ